MDWIYYWLDVYNDWRTSWRRAELPDPFADGEIHL